MNLFKGFAIGLAILLLLVLVWGVAIEPYQVDIENQTAVIPNLPPEWQGRQVAVLGDFQLGMWGDNEATVAKAVQHLVELQPAVVLLLGDFIYHAPSSDENEVQKTIDLLGPLAEANIPMFAVLGNHDYQVNAVGETPNQALAGRLRQRLEAAGIRVLENETITLPSQQPADAPFFLVGIGPHQPKLDDPEQALADLPQDAPRFVMMHNPASFGDFPAGAAPSAVAGHTHGGQIRIPGTPEWSYLTFVQSEPVHTDGWIEDYGQANNRLYVNRGIGFSLLPVRINCMPEVTIFNLEPAQE
jgi:predicted MPP superfamily phosphohydrolase